MARKKKGATKGGAADRPAILAKKKQVAELAAKIKKAKVVGIVQLKELPDKQLQKIRNALRGKADFKTAKNSVLLRAIDAAKKGESLKQYITGPSALVLTEMQPYELFKFVKDRNGKAAAKPGQIAPFEIIVPEGETTLPPGPALSELKAAKINAQIKAGKIWVAKDSPVAKTGEKISDVVAKALQKLGIEPFEVGMKVLAMDDGQFTFSYDVLNIDETQLKEDLMLCLNQALNFSINANYPTEQNIDIVITRALRVQKELGKASGTINEETLPGAVADAVKEAAEVGKLEPAKAEEKKE